eukprot:COSAG04_NODE_12734_length_637_cov_2.940520_1_plen_64_part_00
MLEQKAKEAEAPACGRAAARPPRVMYEQVKYGLWAVPQHTCPPSLSSATPLFSDLRIRARFFW